VSANLRLVIGALAWLALPAALAGIDSAVLGVELRYGHARELDQPVEALIEFTPEVEGRLMAGSRFRVSGRIRVDDQDDLEPGPLSGDSYDPASEPAALGPRGTAELRDAFLEIPLGRALFRAGKQQIVWGALDGIKVLDVVNPQSFREFILDDFGDSRIGLWSAWLDVPLGSWRLELAAAPDTTTHEIPAAGAYFELTAPRWRFGAGADEPALPTIREARGARLDDGLAGMRLSRWARGFDLQLFAVSGLDHEPLGRIAAGPSGPHVALYHERRNLFGFSAQFAAGPANLRTEVSYQPDRTFNVRQAAELKAVDRNQWRAAIGVDLAGPWDVFVNAQYLVDHVNNAPATLIRPSTDQLATLFLRKTFRYETVRTELRWYGSTQEDDGLVRAALTYQLGDNTTVRLAADTFYGDRDGVFGQFADRDRITLALSHTF
jgi:hypothetical protein